MDLERRVHLCGPPDDPLAALVPELENLRARLGRARLSVLPLRKAGPRTANFTRLVLGWLAGCIEAKLCK